LLLLLQAFAADSADQSPWIYYRWLLGNSLAHLQAAQQQQQQQQQETTAGGSSSSVEEAQVVLAEVCGGWHAPCMEAALLL
jgi:dethiobiotin synthetase